MKIWKRTDSHRKLGVAIYNYREDGNHRLPLDIGDTVHILEEVDEWFLGFAIKNRAKKGIFPKNYIALKDATVHISGSHETVTSKEHPLVLELTSVVREWHAIWKQMFVDGNPQLEEVRKMIENMIDWRSKILSRKFTIEELKKVQQVVTAQIDYGNKLLKLDLVVRDDMGHVLDPDQTSVIEVYRRHVEAAERLEKATRNRDSNNMESRQLNWPSSFNMYVMLRNFVCKIGEDADILVNLFDAKEEKFISENYLVNWGKQGIPKDIDMLNNFRVVFTDLGSKDRLRAQVFLIFQIIRIGVMDPKYVDNKKQTQGIRRPFGVAVMDVTEWLQGENTDSEDNHYFVPFQSCGEKEFLYSVIKKVISAKEINHKGQGLWVSLKILPGDMKQVKENYPHLVLPNTIMARKMGFPDVIMPGDVRNDIYVTLMQGEFTKGPSKSTDKNVEVSMSVCNSNGDVLQDVISYGCTNQMVSEYKSLVYYHEDKPKWYEIIKVAISTEVELKGLHLKFVYRHKSSSEAKDRSEKPFAMSFIRLMNDNATTLDDKVHDLLVYKIESKKPDDAKVYLSLPCSKQEQEAMGSSANHKLTAGGLILSSRDYLQVSSYVCSTKLTHNVDLLGLLKWQEVVADTKSLKIYLERLMKEEGEEIVKFLQDLLDSLFNILMQQTSNELCDNLVFDALVYIIVLISERKYLQFRPILDAYIYKSFSFAMAYNKLMVILKDYVDKANEKCPQSDGSDVSLLNAMKSLEYIFKFIIKSRCHFSMLNEGRGKQQFEISLKQLITAINNMMVYTSDKTLLIQGAALKYMSSIISDVMTVFDPVMLSELLVQFINSLPPDRLTKQKMKCIDQIILTELFDLHNCRQIMLPAFLRHTHELMMQKVEMEECISILSHIMDKMWKSDKHRDQDISIIMDKVLRTVIQSVVGMEENDKQEDKLLVPGKQAVFKIRSACIDLISRPKGRSHKVKQFFGDQPPPPPGSFGTMNGNCVAVMVSILRQMTEEHFMSYIQSFPTVFDLTDFLMEIMCVFTDLVNRRVYQSDWLEMVMIQNSIILRALRFFASTIYSHFSNPFEQQVWNNFFHCAIAFLTQGCLQLDTFSVSKRSKIISKYKDMRRETGFEIRSMWSKLGPNKIKFIPQLVGPFLEMTLIPETELRKATIPIFFDMMVQEFSQPIPYSDHIQGNFNEFENEIITKLDTLIEGGRGDEQYMELFTEILKHLCEGNDKMCEQGVNFVTMVHNLLERLLVYRTIIQDEIKEHRMSCIVNLLDFYHDINRQEMYIRYLKKLCELHHSCDNFTEAANTLMLYASLLQWTSEPLAPMLVHESYPNLQTHRELKEKLYGDIISYFENGKMWEKGIKLCEELCSIYKEQLFDYDQLAKCLRKQAHLYDSVMKSMRPEPEYFRVGYFGQGFPIFLQNKVFIYRGKEYERLADFNARMQTLFPNAELMKKLDSPDQEVLESSKQYLQINAVTPVMELKESFQDKDISEAILKYYKVNEVQTFTFSRRSDESGNDVTKMWLERTNMKTSHPFPGIVGWYPVIDVNTFSVSPIENAIETMEEKNKKLSMIIEQHSQDDTLRVDPLGMQLNGVVDPAVSGGIANYKDFYIGDDFDPLLQDRLKEATIEQVTILRDGLMVHKNKAPPSLQPFHTHMEQRFTQMCSMIEKEYDIKVANKGFTNASLQRNQSMPSSSSSSYRVSSVSVNSLNIPEPVVASMNATPRANASRSQSVWVKDKSGSAPPKVTASSKVSLSTLKKRVSQVTEQLADVSLRNSLDTTPIELSEQKGNSLSKNSTPTLPVVMRKKRFQSLTPKRPPRPETERRPSRPPSGQMRYDSLTQNSGSINSLASSLSGSQSGSTGASRLSQDVSDIDTTPEEPPPLPEKQGSIDLPEVVRRSSSASQGRQKPPPPLPPSLLDGDDLPPPVPPKPFLPPH